MWWVFPFYLKNPPKIISKQRHLSKTLLHSNMLHDDLHPNSLLLLYFKCTLQSDVGVVVFTIANTQLGSKKIISNVKFSQFWSKGNYFKFHNLNPEGNWESESKWPKFEDRPTLGTLPSIAITFRHSCWYLTLRSIWTLSVVTNIYGVLSASMHDFPSINWRLWLYSSRSWWML